MWPSAPRRAQAQAAVLTEPDDPAQAEVAVSAGAVSEADSDPGPGPGPGPGFVPGRWTRWSTWLVLGGYLLAALIVTWRLWADPASRTVAGNPDDADLFAW